jgi:hypothetical protein
VELRVVDRCHECRPSSRSSSFCSSPGCSGRCGFVVTNPRRRARHIAAELSAPPVENSEPFVVAYKRLLNVGGAATFAIIAGNIGARSTSRLSVVAIGLCVLVVVWRIRVALDPRPVLVIDGDGVKLIRRGRTLRWVDIETSAIDESYGLYGVEQHSLVLTLAPHDENPTAHASLGVVRINADRVTVPLDLLSPHWDQIARAIHERSGRRPQVPRKYTIAQPQ